MARLVNQSSIDENIAMFLQYGISELTTNDGVIAREIQQQYEHKLMFDDAAITSAIHEEEGILQSSLSDDEKLARYLQQDDESENHTDEDIQEIHPYQPMQVNHSYIPQRDTPSTSRAFYYNEDGDSFSSHYTHILSSYSSHSLHVNENIDSGNMTYEDLNELEESIGDVGKGLSQRRISKLPTHKYGTKTKKRWWQKKKKFVANDTQCSICLVDYVNGDKITTLPCNHIYHKDCISHWLKQNKVCCVCKAEV